MICSIFVRSKSLQLVADAVKEACEGICVEEELRKVTLRGENVENPLEEEYAIDVYVEFDGTPELLFSIGKTRNEEIITVEVLKDTEDFEVCTGYAVADFVHDVIEVLLEKFGWDNVKWLFIY
jgi:hypothetical protein